MKIYECDVLSLYYLLQVGVIDVCTLFPTQDFRRRCILVRPDLGKGKSVDSWGTRLDAYTLRISTTSAIGVQ